LSRVSIIGFSTCFGSIVIQCWAVHLALVRKWVTWGYIYIYIYSFWVIVSFRR
jgi:hypothetical protein